MLIAHVCLACATSDEACHVQPSRREPGGVCHVWSKLGCVGKVTSARLSVDLPLGLFDQGRKVFLLLVSIIGGAHILLSLFVNKLI